MVRARGGMGPLSAITEGRKLMTHGGDRRSEKVRDQVDNVHLKPTNQLNSNSKERLLARLHRDHPDIVEKVHGIGRGEIVDPGQDLTVQEIGKRHKAK